ncbi:uncharacterized protein phf11 isoform X2 [Thunnus albacares]|uniref:uncharacterized protein phf11 isoform X2 n=1 Tax=Thunnus albacares TaxID=8236 RepID=UPI001CF68F9C|nr:uncharacterized protein phf11 isoform X2 [Thunnus albacares]
MVEMGNDRKVSCILCQRSEETRITGALSTKDQITAHQNCLLFSSGIYCQNSPEFDDLFGFSVEDVMKEVRRGNKLACYRCKKKGATAGCEIKRCKKSYHYPCAVQEGAHIVEDDDEGNYTLYCSTHYEEMQRINGSTSEHDSSPTNHRKSKKSSKTSSSKVYCLACEKTEGNISLDSLSNSVIMLYCDKHGPLSHKSNGHDDSPVAGPSFWSSDSNSASSMTHGLKRRLSFNDIEEEMLSRRKPETWKRKISDDSNSVENEPNTEMAMFAPLESDLDESANSLPEHQVNSKDAENGSPTGSISGNQPMDENGDGNKDEDETVIHSDAESESLLLPVEICIESYSTLNSSFSNHTVSPPRPSVTLTNTVEVLRSGDEGSSPEQNPGSSPEYIDSPAQHTAAPSVPPQSSSGPPLSPDHCKPCIVSCSSLRTSSAISPAPPETICVSPLPSTSSPTVAPSDPATSIDSTCFWRSCNMAGCTEAIFTDFIDEMKDISGRIQSDQASQEDYELALKVMAASGKLTELVAKQQKELEKRQMQLQKEAAAMKKVVSALR